MTPSTRKWLEQALYDLETAKAMLATDRWLYVLFCCQQALEKSLKALIVTRTGEFPPRIHNLARLAELSDLTPDEERALFLAELSAYYIQARYPEEVEELLKLSTKELASDTLKKTEEMIQWLSSMMQ